MARAISVRLDEEAERALRTLMRGGRSRSEAVRDALLETANRRRGRRLAAEARRVAADPVDRAEMSALLEFMERLDDPR